MQSIIYAIASILIISVVSLIGIITLNIKKDFLSKITLFFVSFAVGALIGDSFIHLLPEAFEKLNYMYVSILTIGGILIFFVLEKFLKWRHCHADGCKEHTHPTACMNMIGDSVHNLIDGILIGASYLINIQLGIATTIAVLLHEIPQEIGDFGILIHNKVPIKKAILFNFLSSLSAIAGGVIVLIIGNNINNLALILLPVTAGGFLYIAGSDLIPELHNHLRLKTSFIQLLCIITGIVIMLLLKILD